KLLQGGMQVYIDPDGKKEKTTEVVYPVKGELSEEEMRPQGVPGQKQDLTQIHQHVASQLISLNRIGFKPEYNGVQSVRENTGFKAAINWDENNDLVYELVVPYAAFPSSIKKDRVQLGFFISGIDRPKQTAGENAGAQWTGGGQGAGGAMGGHHGNGSNFGGGRRGGGGGHANGQNSSNNWQKVYVNENFWLGYS